MYAPNPTQGSGLTPEERLWLAFQADGCLLRSRSRKGGYTLRFMFRRARKIERMRWILATCGYPYTETVNARGDTSFLFHLPYAPSKRLDWVTLGRSGTWYEEALTEIALWDGWYQDAGIHYESDAFNAERVQMIATLAGRVSSIKQVRKAFRVSSWPKSVRSSKALSSVSQPYDGMVYCVRMPHGTVVSRRNGKVTVTGNCHRMGAEHFSQAMWWFPAKLRLGLSATPYRRDGRDQVFLGHIGEVQLTARQETMIPRIVIRHSDFKVPRVYRNGSYIKLPHEAGKTGHITKMLSRNNARNQLIAKFVAAAHRKARNTIVFSDSLAHLDAIHSEVVIAGVPAQDIGYYVGLGGTAYTGPERERKKQRERVKILPVILATYQMTSEATDVPWLDACVLGTPRSDVVQIIGRIRREYPDKPMPVVLDIVDGDSPVFAAFAAKRMRWYAELGCEVRVRD